MLLLLQLLLAHLVNRYLLRVLLLGKPRHPSRVILGYVTGYYVCALVFVNWGITGQLAVAIGLLGLVHAGVDYLERSRRDDWLTFLLAQGFHLLALSLVAVRMAAADWVAFGAKLTSLASDGRLYLYSTSYVAAVFVGGVLVQRVTQSFLAKMTEELTPLKPGLPEAGRYIGYLERFLILTFVLADNYEAIGFLLAAKTLVRYPDISEDRKGHFGEYYLVGTLTSFGWALIVGACVHFIRTHVVF